jgi:hypothetical protein
VRRWDRAYEWGLAYAMVVITVPLGLRLLSGLAFGGRGYVVSLSGAVVICGLAVMVALRRGRRLPMPWAGVVAAAVVAGLWSGVGIAHHGLPQTATGLRLIVIPTAMIVIVAALPHPAIERMITLLAWLTMANAAAAVVELAVGPARLVRIGFSDTKNVRYIDGVFRVPGLTEVNAELGMLAGAYLLGYVASWLTPETRPRRWPWHAGAVAAVACLALSTSRSGAVLLVAGVLGAVLLRRPRGRARRALSLALAGGLVVVVAGAFAVLGAAGSRSLFERFGVWRDLVRAMPPFGYGIGGAGAATFSRVASSAPVPVDNYFLNIGLQFGPVVMAAFAVAVAGALVWLARRSADDPRWTVVVAAVAGLATASLVIDAWEFPAAVLALALFCAHGLREEAR